MFFWLKIADLSLQLIYGYLSCVWGYECVCVGECVW